VNHAGLQYLHKYSILLSQVNLRDVSDSDYLRGSVGWAITNLTPIIIDNAETLLTLNKRQLNNLLQIPFSHLEQLLHDSKIEAGHIKFQQSMIIELLDFYQSMHQLLASNEFLQVSVFAFIIETILMTSSDSVLQVNQAMLFNFSDHEKLQFFLT